jgi:hypothetical protein
MLHAHYSFLQLYAVIGYPENGAGFEMTLAVNFGHGGVPNFAETSQNQQLKAMADVYATRFSTNINRMQVHPISQPFCST